MSKMVMKKTMLAAGLPKICLEQLNWPKECEGKTKEEMEQMGYRAPDDWLVEAKEEKE